MVTAPERRDRVEGEVVVPATGVQLEVVLLDAETFAVADRVETGDGELGIVRVGEDGAVHVRRRVGQAREATGVELGGEQAAPGRAAGIEVADRRALEGRRPRVRRAHRGREVDHLANGGRGGIPQSRDGDGGPDGAPRAVGVNVGPHGRRASDARADLIAGDDALQQATPVEAALFRDGQRARHDVDGGMTAAQAIALVDLERDTGCRIGQRGPEGIRPRAIPEQRRRAMPSTSTGQAGQTNVLVEPAAGNDGAERVEENELRRRDRARR